MMKGHYISLLAATPCASSSCCDPSRSMNASNQRLTFPPASHGSLISDPCSARLLESERADNARGLPELHGGGKLQNKDPANERKRKMKTENRVNALETWASCHEKRKRIESHACGFGCVERLACSCQVHKSARICLRV